jgi:hypothetical protein
LQLGVCLKCRLLGALAFADVRPGPNQLARMAVLVFDDLKAILDPDVVPVAVTEAILN